MVTSDGAALFADYVVLAAATGTASLARQAGVFAPIVAIKGYSITLPLKATTLEETQNGKDATNGPDSSPRVVLIDSEADSHVYATPLGDHLRVAGIAEFAGSDRSIRSEVPLGLRDLAINLYPGLADKHGCALGFLCELD